MRHLSLLIFLALPLALAAMGCSDEETRQQRLVRSVDGHPATSGGEAPPIPDLFNGRVGMSFAEIDAACVEAGGRFGVVASGTYRCRRVQGPVRMQGSRTEEFYRIDASQRCVAAYYLIHIPSQTRIRFRGHRLSPREAARRMYIELIERIEPTVHLRRVDGSLRVSARSYVRVGIDELDVFIEVGMPRPSAS